MKKIYNVLVILAIMLISACNVLDVEPHNTIAADDAIKNAKDLEKAVVGCYDALQFSGYYGRDVFAVSDLLSDNLQWSGTTQAFGQIDNINIIADNAEVASIWAAIYTAINRVNITLDEMTKVSGLADAKKKQYSGELHFLRALHLFNLTRYFGDVIVRTKPVNSTSSELNMPRSLQATVFTQIESDLKTAEIELQGISHNSIRASSLAAKALLAKVYLEWACKDAANMEAYLSNAITKASEVITAFNDTLNTPYADLFLNENVATESIFEVQAEALDRNTIAYYFYPTASGGRLEFSVTADLVSAFETGDVRKTASIVTGSANYCIKYNDIVTGSDNVYVLRLAEMFLLRAEARLRKSDYNSNTTLIKKDINMVRTRAELANTNANTYDELEAVILKERRIEFAFEGHRWFDLIRFGKAKTILNIQDYELVMPIPLEEILANSNAKQNQGY